MSTSKELTERFIEAVKHTFNVQFKLKILVSTPFTKAGPGLDRLKAHSGTVAISGVLPIQSNQFNGDLAICFSEEMYLKLINIMLASSYKAINAEIEDGAAEFANIIFGHAKKLLNDAGYNLQMARPVIVRTENPLVASVNGIVIIPFTSDLGNFHFEIAPKSHSKVA